MNTFPRLARVTDSRWSQFGPQLVQMGLIKQEFHAVDADKNQVVVDPNDLSKPKEEPFTIRRDFVEFMEES